MRTSFRVLLAVAGLAAAGVAGGIAYAWAPAIAAIEPPPASAFAPALVARGATLAALGNCAGCHSAADNPAYSGGVPIETPFGTIYGSNITPDRTTGIGSWSEAAFRRALREGVDRAGRHLYPAFPYDHFTRVTDDDIAALYAFVMTRSPGANRPPANALPFPLNIRMLVAGWKLLYFRPGAWRPDPARDAPWNRGAYLVEGLGHCGACHTPRNALGAEKEGAAFAGGQAEGWNAYALNAASPAPIPWSVDALGFYLKHGWAEHHGIARGPMAAVTANLATIPDDDLSAMGTYLVSLMGAPSPERQARARALLDDESEPNTGASAGTQVVAAASGSARGAALYAQACAACHSGVRPLPFGGLDLAKSTALAAPDPTNLIIVTRDGLPAAPGEPSAVMPGFAGALDDGQIADLLAYMRGTIAKAQPWPHLGATIEAIRTHPPALRPSDGTSAAPADPSVRATTW